MGQGACGEYFVLALCESLSTGLGKGLAVMFGAAFRGAVRGAQAFVLAVDCGWTSLKGGTGGAAEKRLASWCQFTTAKWATVKINSRSTRWG